MSLHKRISDLIAKPRIDLNCDLGESFGAYTIGNDEALMKFATSVNIACGFHGGDPSVMRRTVDLAVQHGVGIGAHPGLPDLVGFGRRTMQVSASDVADITLYQVGALQAFVRSAGGRLAHVKPHGALYNMLAVNRELADAFVKAVAAFDADLVIYGLANSYLPQAAERWNLRTAHEAFADRTYQADGTLTDRTTSNALIRSAGEVAAQAVSIVMNKTVRATDGTDVHVHAHTVCLHGDSPDSVRFARAVVRGLKSAGIELRAFG
jgi:5-oxoprolinase (ATP-hydrolysing) subunit A